MTLLIHCPPGFRPERTYSSSVVFSEWFGVEFEVVIENREDVEITLRDDPERRSITMPDTLFALDRETWLHLSIDRPVPELPRPGGLGTDWSHLATGALVPVVFGNREALAAAASKGPCLALAVDVLGTAFYFLTHAGEPRDGLTDPLGRVMAGESAAGHLVGRPVVDEAVDLLGDAITTQWPRLALRRGTFRLRLTHDVDQPYAAFGRTAHRIMRSVAADVLRRRDLELAARRLAAAARARQGPAAGDPSDTFAFLMDVSERHGLRSTFFFLAGNEPGEIDFRYRLEDPPYARIVQSVYDRGHGIGLHASYLSHGDLARTRSEFEALLRVAEPIGVQQSRWGVRQHRLRFLAPDTWRIQAGAGLSWDASDGFHDQPGFRAGTSRPFTVFDVRDGAHLALVEHPLIVMDVTLIESLRLDPAEAARTTLNFVQMCRRHAGEASVLVHNNLLPGRRERQIYRELVEEASRN